MLRVLTLSTLYPSAARPQFGTFVHNRLVRLAERNDVELDVIAPVGLPPAPLSRHPHYKPLLALPKAETWASVPVLRPRYLHLPVVGWRLDPALIARACLPYISQRDKRADLLNAEFFFPDGIAASIIARKLKLPFTIQARGSDIHYWGERPSVRAAMLRAANTASGLLAVSAALKADMVALGMRADRIEVHYTGVDLDSFRPLNRAQAKAQWGISGPLVVSAGNLIPLKGHEIVIRAIAALPGVSLLIAGEGPERANLMQAATRLGVSERVRLLGSVPHANIARLLAAADVVALASEREGLATVWVEALACGTPLVAPRVGGIAEVLDRPEAGRITERTPAAFASAIAQLIAASPPQSSVRAAAERFTWPQAIDAFYTHLRRVAGQG